MISRMRPRRPCVSDEAPIKAIDFGQRSFVRSGTEMPLAPSCAGLGRASTSSLRRRKTWMAGTSPAMTRRQLRRRPSSSSQPQLARDDAAQYFGGAALDRQLGGDLGREGELLLERRAVARLGA